MVYTGFSVRTHSSTGDEPVLESKESLLNENFLEIIKKDEQTKDIYSEFSNKSIFDLNKEKTLEIQKTQKTEENKIFDPANVLERDYGSGAMYHDIDPDNLINYDNFNKYLNEQRGSTDNEITASFDLRGSEQRIHQENIDEKDDYSFKLEPKAEHHIIERQMGESIEHDEHDKNHKNIGDEHCKVVERLHIQKSADENDQMKTIPEMVSLVHSDLLSPNLHCKVVERLHIQKSADENDQMKTIPEKVSLVHSDSLSPNLPIIKPAGE